MTACKPPDRERSSRGGRNAQKHDTHVDMWAAAKRFSQWYQENYPEEQGQ